MQTNKQIKSRRLAFFFDRLNDVRRQIKRAQVKFKISCETDCVHQRAEMLQSIWAAQGKNDTTALWLEDQQHESIGKIKKLERELANI